MMDGDNCLVVKSVAQWLDEEAQLSAAARLVPAEHTHDDGNGEDEDESESESDEESSSESDGDSDIESEDEDENEEDDEDNDEATTDQHTSIEDPGWRPLPIPFALRFVPELMATPVGIRYVLRPEPLHVTLRTLLPLKPPHWKPQPGDPPWPSLSMEQRLAICRGVEAARPPPPSSPPSPPKRVFRPCFGASCPVGCTLDRHEVAGRGEDLRQRWIMSWREMLADRVMSVIDRERGEAAAAVGGDGGKTRLNPRDMTLM